MKKILYEWSMEVLYGGAARARACVRNIPPPMPCMHIYNILIYVYKHIFIRGDKQNDRLV